MSSISSYDEIHIVSGGKTGSSTLFQSFRRLHRNVFHAHNCTHLRRSVQCHQKILVVNSYRLPFSRHISSLFQNIKTHVPGLVLHGQPVLSYSTVANRLDNYLNNHQFFESYHPMLEMVNMSSLSFSPRQGYSFLPNLLPNMDVILLRFDKIQEWESQIQSLIPNFRLVPDNLSSRKTYAALYHYFRKHYRFPPSAKYLWEVEQPMISVYYSEEEKQVIYQDFLTILR